MCPKFTIIIQITKHFFNNKQLVILTINCMWWHMKSKVFVIVGNLQGIHTLHKLEIHWKRRDLLRWHFIPLIGTGRRYSSSKNVVDHHLCARCWTWYENSNEVVSGETGLELNMWFHHWQNMMSPGPAKTSSKKKQ